MENMSDNDFFKRVAEFLDDAPPEKLLNETSVLKRIQDCLLSLEPSQNLQALTILRAFARKLTIRVKLLNDNRVKWQGSADNYQSFKQNVEKAVVGFADLTASLMKKNAFLPLALVTCKELLNVTKSAPTETIVEYAMQHVNDEHLKIPVLEIVANSDCVISDLPLFDPQLVIEYPLLHQQLINISPKESQKDVKDIMKTFNIIQKINRGDANIDRNLLQWCNFDKCFGRIPNYVLASHPDEKIRIKFYQKAKEENLDVLTFLTPLLCSNQFDNAINETAKEIIINNIDSILTQKLTITELICLQCFPFEKGSHLFEALTNYLNRSDSFTRICGWARFLYSNEEWIRNFAKDQLSDMLEDKINFDITNTCPVDTMLSDFRTRQKINGTKNDPMIIQGLIDTIFNDDQQTFVKTASTKRLVNFILNPFNSIKRYTSSLSKLPFKDYATLLHAVSIRDYNYVLDDADKIIELFKVINEDNKRDLLPILSRSIFVPVTKMETSGTSFLRMPSFTKSSFEIPGSAGFYDMQLYKNTESVSNSEIIEKWTSYKPHHEKPIKPGFNIQKLTQLVISNGIFASDCMLQLETDESSRECLLASGTPGNILFFLCMASLSSRSSNKEVCKICSFLLPSASEIGLKLAQLLTEFGGECEIPDGIQDMIADEKTRRCALGFLCAKINSNQRIDGVDINSILDLLKEKLPINVLRQTMVILLSYGKQLPKELVNQKDFSIKAMALHMSGFDEETIELATKLMFSDSEATVVRVACMEILSKYYRENPIPNISFLPLFNSQSGETITTFFLLRLLAIPKIRDQIEVFPEFVLQYLTPNTSEKFVFAALYTLPKYEFKDERIAKALEVLINIDQYTNTVLHLLTTFSDETLSVFTSEMMFYITDTFSNFDISLGLININRMILIGTEFPGESIPHIINLYQAIVENNIDSKELRLVLMQVFSQSNLCKKLALKRDFLKIALAELMNSNDTQYYEVIKLCSCFVYDFPKGQTKLLKTWGIKTLHTIFEPHPVILNFFLSFVKNNETTQQCFEEVYPKNKSNAKIPQTTLLDMLLDEIDKTKKASSLPLLLELFSNILNGRAVRNKIFLNTKLIPHYVTLVQKYASERKVAQLEGWLRVFVMLSLHPDGMEKLYEFTRVTELLLFFFKSCDEIRTNKIFIIFLRNLIKDKKRWRSLKANIIRECEDSHDEYLASVFESLIQKAKDSMN